MNDYENNDYFMTESEPTSFELNEYSRTNSDNGKLANINQNWSNHTDYEDKYIKISSTQVELKNYFFPTASSKTILIRDIVNISTPEKLGVPWYDVMIWGRGISNIWWAKDSGRDQGNCSNTVCIRVKGETSLKACSALDRRRVIGLIEYLISSGNKY
ncbi:hypothetical protein CONCODRAFT_77676 [Conidiobolus coronatus NRRL 28638]|uniref:Uncharacterized protein n=1 Tax=Conidiobolus coronatus (strain ATCC 28846 / CBS 209.66 / NRRL 28638) TaxID=796925 RepID=A0A137PCA4_CONC2|nr:hypothetical protein CONCODRAFT_77676 [Conidiobolus coronatus NRRL 28638]|eukprot:KXN72637.1 hypothetical protein CONCODRAFT_77676 [Conidiobolus coronatus NRRL 28638]